MTGLAYSICTLVSDRAQYAECVASFRAHGFTEPDCEFIEADNTAVNAHEAYATLNRFLRQARGRTVILCHQDIILTTHGRPALDGCIAGMDSLDPTWGVLGSAGALDDGAREDGARDGGGLAIALTDPNNAHPDRTGLPARCMSLDEAFLVVRADANLALSRDLQGFHLYGTDLCLVADILGWSAWVIDFPLHHFSAGRMGPEFETIRAAMIAKYRRALRSRVVATTCTTMPITGSPMLGQLGRSTKGQGVWRWLVRLGLA